MLEKSERNKENNHQERLIDHENNYLQPQGCPHTFGNIRYRMGQKLIFLHSKLTETKADESHRLISCDLNIFGTFHHYFKKNAFCFK